MEEGVMLQWRRVEAAECELHRFGGLANSRRDSKRALEDESHGGGCRGGELLRNLENKFLWHEIDDIDDREESIWSADRVF